MSYHYESFQSTLPPNVSAGWNDPPLATATTVTSATTTSHLIQMRRRLVDPSITGPSYGAHASHGYGGQQGHQQNHCGAPGAGYGQQQAPQGYAAAQQYGQAVNVNPQGGYPQSQQYPSAPTGQFSPTTVPTQQQGQQFFPHGQQPAQMSPTVAQPPPQYPQQTVPQHQTPQIAPSVIQNPPQYPQQAALQYQQPPAQISPSAYSQASHPVQQHHYGSVPQQQPQQQSVPPSPNTTAPPNYPYQQHPAYPTTNNVASHYPNADSAAVTPQANMPSMQHRSIYAAFTVTNGTQHSVKTDVFQTRPQTSNPAPASHAAWTYQSPIEQITKSTSLGSSSPPVMAQPIESDPQSLIFAPPNVVPNAEYDPQSDYKRSLVKCAGDVSLSGSQLVQFLYKATTRLPPAKCEGVQLKLQQLNDYVDQGRLSEPCLHKLNYLVDAIDRGLYNEAGTFFTQLQSQFPHELGYWGAGLRLLVSELRGTGTRVGSAGVHIRNQ